MFNLIFDKRGVAALLTVVIVSAAVLIMAFSAAFLGLGELDMGWTSQKGEEARAWTEGCLEQALYRLKWDDNYSGETLSIGDNSCIIEVQTNGNERSLLVLGTINNYQKKIGANVTLINNNLTLNSWQEMDN